MKKKSRKYARPVKAQAVHETAPPVDVHADLQAAARRVASALVVRALEELAAADAPPSRGIRALEQLATRTGGAPFTVTVTPHAPAPAQRQLPTHATIPAASAPTPRATPTAKPLPPPAAPGQTVGKRPYGSKPLLERACKRCDRTGTLALVPGTDRELECSVCHHRWTARIAATGVTPTCKDCSHTASAHVEYTGRCTHGRCACHAFRER